MMDLHKADLSVLGAKFQMVELDDTTPVPEHTIATKTSVSTVQAQQHQQIVQQDEATRQQGMAQRTIQTSARPHRKHNRRSAISPDWTGRTFKRKPERKVQESLQTIQSQIDSMEQQDTLQSVAQNLDEAQVSHDQSVTDQMRTKMEILKQQGSNYASPAPMHMARQQAALLTHAQQQQRGNPEQEQQRAPATPAMQQFYQQTLSAYTQRFMQQAAGRYDGNTGMLSPNDLQQVQIQAKNATLEAVRKSQMQTQQAAIAQQQKEIRYDPLEPYMPIHDRAPQHHGHVLMTNQDSHENAKPATINLEMTASLSTLQSPELVGQQMSGIHHTISEDRTGDMACNISKRLAVFNNRQCRKGRLAESQVQSEVDPFEKDLADQGMPQSLIKRGIPQLGEKIAWVGTDANRLKNARGRSRNNDFESGVDPELAMALRLSWEQERTRLNREHRARKEVERSKASRTEIQAVEEPVQSSIEHPSLVKRFIM